MANKSLKTMIFILLFILVLAIAFVFGYEYFSKSASAKPTVQSADQLQQEQYSLGEITTNLQGDSVIQVTITLQTNNMKARDELEKRKAQVMDTVGNILHNSTKVDIDKQ